MFILKHLFIFDKTPSPNYMDIENIRAYCLNKPAVSESLPFDNNTLVFKVGSKMFALMSLDADPLGLNLKCDPDKAILLRNLYPQIMPGYHMNKKHWNSIKIDGMLSPSLIRALIDHSYELVVNGLTKKECLKFNI